MTIQPPRPAANTQNMGLLFGLFIIALLAGEWYTLRHQLDIAVARAAQQAVATTGPELTPGQRAHFGQIDVLLNNAGYGLFGAIEETTEAQARSQMETNFFGVLWMTQAIVPLMREQKSGHIIQVSSFLGLITLPVLGCTTHQNMR